MKRKLSKMVAVFMAIALLGCSLGAHAEEAIQTILNAKTTQAFTQDLVSDEDLNTILEAGTMATSGMNQQPWYFAVVTNQEIMSEIAGASGFGGAPIGAPAGDLPEGFTPPTEADVPGEEVAEMAEGGKTMPQGVPAMGSGSAKASLGDSPVAIIIYTDGGSSSTTASFDCGLACQNMVIAANALGYGTKIVSSPTIALNGENHDALCEKLGVDTSMNAVAVLLVGIADTEVDGATGATTRSAIEEKVSFVK